MAQESVDLPSARGQRITYRSFLLRLRRVEGGSVQQFFIKDIQTKEEFYFANLHEMMSFFNIGTNISINQREEGYDNEDNS